MPLPRLEVYSQHGREGMAEGVACSCGSRTRSLARILEDQEAEEAEEVRMGYKLQGLFPDQ